jgi:hypothetical protein
MHELKNNYLIEIISQCDIQESINIFLTLKETLWLSGEHRVARRVLSVRWIGGRFEAGSR